MLFAVVNLSSKVRTADAELMTGAVAYQVVNHVAPAWGLGPVRFALYHDAHVAPEGAARILITDDADRLGSYGYHDIGPDGRPYARVFVDEIMIMGGGVLQGANSVSATLSHEVVEAVVDPDLDRWRKGPGGDWPVEVCDPVQTQSYSINVEGKPVSVSNFVLPRFYVPGQTRHLDFQGRLSRAFSVAPGGYTAVRGEDGRVSRLPVGSPLQGAKGHPAARTFRRGVRA